MASKKKQKDMVFHQEGVTTPATAAAASHPPSCCATPKPGKASEGGMEEAVVRGGERECPASLDSQSDTLPPETICRGIKVTLENHSMWNVFFSCGTEMILTEQGSRMFPYCRFRISGLQISRRYTLMMDIQPLDNNNYKWTGKNWQAAGKAARHIKSQPFVHPESPATGQHWMQSPVSFYRMKLTNNMSDQEGNTILHPMQRYLPRLHVVQTDKAAKDIKLNDPSVVTVSFPQTEFMAVIAYQNTRFIQLKVDYNPFAKGLKEDGSTSWGRKLKANSGNPLHKHGGTAAPEQHPVKESLKSLLANHKPRSSKTPDSNSSVPGDLQKASTINKDPHAAMPPGESLGSVSRPAQKLFSELIREAHVSLQRCNLEQLSINHSTSLRVEQPNTKNSTLNAKGHGVIQMDSTSVKVPPRKSETKRKVKEDRQLLNSLNCKDNVRTVSSGAASPGGAQNSSEDTDHRYNLDATTEASVKQHRRPARLPLPALALFLKQHSKKTKNKPDSPPPAAPSECLSRSPSSAAASAHLPSVGATSATDPSKDLGGNVLKSDITTSGCADTQDDVVLNVTGQTAAAGHLTCPRTYGRLAPISESLGSELIGPDGTPVLPNSDQPFCTLGASLTTSSLPPTVPLPLDTVLHSPNSPQTPPESSTLPLDSPTLKSSLPDPECSSLGFEPLSPASSPEPLPHLPASIALELNSTASEAPCAAGPPEDLQDTEDPSVFKWHTVLPPPESFVDTSFTFHSPPQTLPSATPPLLPSQTPDDPEPQTPNTCIPTSAPHPPPSFQENEQSLPFPAELSPLALQLPLSPTFSSIDGDGLSPTPSLADLVQFLSADVDLGIEFSNTEAAAVPCSPTSETHEPSQQGHLLPPIKPCKRKNKKIRQRRLGKTNMQLEVDDTTYRNMQPNLEEVEEQLFISFTSKEALKFHIADSSDRLVPRPQATPEGQRAADSPENNNRLDRNDEQSNNLNSSKPSESLEETIASFQKILLRDLKLMKHKQVIHPVLQEVGLKMTLLDPTLSIDLQYLGVHLPIPPPGTGTETVSTSQGVSAAFVSRTGKTTDVTQIKGWREKFTLSETQPTPAACRPEAGSSSELQKKNLSAFCSDMLDEYLESEGKLIDERAASFSQLPVEPLVYELPSRSTSYVRTLDHILKKQTADPAASDLISGFIPPSKRPRLKEPKAGRRGERKQKGPKPNKPRLALSAALGSEPSPVKAQQPAAHAPMMPTSHPAADPNPVKRRRRRLKPRTSSQTLSPFRATDPMSSVSLDLAPLESDSELGPDGGHGRKSRRQPMTRALLKQKVLEDGVVWEGQRRTSITTERATIALTSLFTQTGFVSENPTAPIQLSRRRAPPCLNEFCRLGCVCPGLSYSSRISHCGRPACMFGCSCLKQKVVLLKNLDGSDSSPSSHQGDKKKKKKKRRRMKMAYVLKEADSVSQPAERVRTLWRRDHGGSDPEPVNAPETAPETRPVKVRKVRKAHGSCARVRGYSRKIQKWKEVMKDTTVRPDWPKPPRAKRLKKTFRQALQTPPATEAPPSEPPPSPPAEPISKPSKRLFIMADFKWKSEADRSHVVMELCEAMARDQLDRPFWIKNYLICPTSQSVEGSGAERCIQYHVKISSPIPNLGKPGAPRRQVDLGRVGRKVQPLEELEHKVVEEAEPPEDWQRELEEDDITEEEGFMGHQLDDGKERSGEEVKFEVSMALPFLTGISPAGFLSANKKQPGGTDQLIQVNGKLYPLAKIQLGKMGALHPANRLAAYLTGRVGSNRQHQQASLRPSSSSCKPPQASGPTPPIVSLASSVLSGLAAIAATTAATSVTTTTTATTSTASTAVTPPKPVTPLNLLTTHTDCLSSSSVVPPVNPSLGTTPSKAPQMVLIQVPPPPGTVPVVAPVSSPQKMLLKPVQTASGVQFYRRPDGKLVQLVPLSQLRPVTPTLPVQKAALSSSTSLLSSAASPDVTVRHQAPPLTTSTSLSVPVKPGSGFLSQKGTCTFKIVSANSSRDPIIVTCAKAPPKPPTKVVVAAQSSFTLLQTRPSNPPLAPVKLFSLKASTAQGTGQGIKTVKAAATGMGGLLVKSALPQTSPAIPTPTEPNHTPQTLPPAGSEFSTLPPPRPAPDVISPEPELARDLVDLDIICVDDEKPLATMERHSVEVTSSSETENSSDFRESESEDEKLPPTNNMRFLHTTLERMRRGRLRQLFDSLRRTVGLPEERMSKVSTLKTAVDVIWELRKTESHLKRKKIRLRKKRDKYLWSIAPSGGQTESMGAVDLLDEPTIISSDEGRVVISDSDVEEEDDEGRGVAVETAGENSWLARKRSSEVEEETAARGSSAALATLRSAVNSSDSAEEQLLEQARQVIQTLQSETKDLKSLMQQRDIHIRDMSSRTSEEPVEEPGKSEQRILRKLQHLPSGQKEMDEERQRATNQFPARGGACRAGDESNGSVMTSSDQQKTAHAPPTSVSSPPTPTPVQTPFQVLPSILTSPVATHNTPVQRERSRTIPNILSRSKTQAPPSPVLTKSAEGEPSSFQALVPTDVLSLVGAALPGKPVLTLNPVTTGSVMLQPTPTPGVASVTLNIPTLTNQQIHLTSLPHPPAGPLAVTNLTASALGSVLQLVQTNTPQQEAPPPSDQLLPAARPEVSAGSLQSTDQITDQDQAPPLSDVRSASLSCQSTDRRLEEREAGPPEPETRGDPENENLTSLLDELVFLNQQVGKQDTAAVGGADEEGHSHSPWMLQLDSDSDTEGAGPDLHTQERQSSAEPELDNSKEGVLTPPPLLQMKVGGTKEASTSSSEGDGTVGPGRGGRMHGGMAWRPMPRLVPLGLRGHAPS
ncbi:MAX dimerization protein MGA a isoform X1 [Archocentrus centrarchus]|uniref:MAX dimerization protein MGA a isoform X1 n=1 Tax=Archocentrus centrarchus TaxID=63155 RepID=UPI0011EA25A1|nr:uncharacterized protein LOC115772301 isoform X1 [Archocentrus centrarchus]XP_030574304.1 uncharacterized protein LOC115772301 isoform X1 [Archocentrus centrarchus]